MSIVTQRLTSLVDRRLMRVAVERFEDDLTDQTRVHRPLSAVVQVDEAIEVSPQRERGGDPERRDGDAEPG